jgi:acyl carrier protein
MAMKRGWATRRRDAVFHCETVLRERRESLASSPNTFGRRYESMDAIEQEVTSLIAAVLRTDRNRISNSALIAEDLAADSLDSVELIMAIEERFAIDIPDEDAEEIRSVRQLIQYVTLAVAIKEAPVTGGARPARYH